ncbi:MAG: glycoside hydrolase family 127 protein [Armatimonadota bacterium]
MPRHALRLLGALFLGLTCLSGSFGQSVRQPVSFQSVRVEDRFWSPKLTVYRERTIPHSWQFVQGEIEDNEIAGGLKQIERGGATPWNQANLHKVLETCAYGLALQPEAALDQKLDHIISLLAAAQRPDGYVNATLTVRKIEPWSWMEGRHEGYVAGHLIEAAVAHYLATGKRNFLDIACKNADHIYRHFITEGNEGICGHAGLELALVRLYRVTGEKRYLELSRNWIERYGRYQQGPNPSHQPYFMNHLPIREVPEVVGHAVRTMFFLTGVTEVANETRDQTLQAAARRLWEDTTLRKLYVTGAVGSLEKDEAFGPAYELPNDGWCESCAACGLIYYAQAMFLLDGDSRSVDVLERALYNVVLHGISLDGVSTYYNNRLTDANHPRDNCWVCCPPCLSRTLLRLPDYIYASTGQSLYVNLYVGGTAQAAIGKRKLTLRQETSYPGEGEVKLTLTPEQPANFYLRLRVPGWCRNYTVSVNGAAVGRPKVERGYVVIRRQWRAGDVVTLDLQMPIERMVAHPAVKADAGRIALQRGPLVYGFEALDNGGNLDFTLASQPELASEYRPDFLGGVNAITGKGSDGRQVMAIPYYALANREPSRQTVWVAQEGLVEDNGGWEGKLYRPLHD